MLERCRGRGGHPGKQLRQPNGEQHFLNQDEADLRAGQPDEPFDAFGDQHQRIDLGPVVSTKFQHHR